MPNFQGHTLSYKLPDGTWVSLPILIQDMYDTYVKACADEGVEAVDKTTYLISLVKVVELADTVAQGNVVTIELGGTGANTVEDARANLEVYSKEETEVTINRILGSSTDTEGEEGSIVARVLKLEQDLEQTKQALSYLEETVERIKSPDVVGIYSGNTEPGPDTLGQIYFQY
jgi:hypothetical protein